MTEAAGVILRQSWVSRPTAADAVLTSFPFAISLRLTEGIGLLG